MKEPVARGRGSSVSSVSSISSVLIRPTVDAVLLVLVLPLLLLIVVLVPWDEVDLSSPHLQLLGIALTFASVLICLKMACAACPYYVDDDPVSRRNSQQSLLSSIEDSPPNYESIMAANPAQNSRWVVAIVPAGLQTQMDPPPYHAVVIEPEGPQREVSHQDKPENTPV